MKARTAATLMSETMKMGKVVTLKKPIEKLVEEIRTHVYDAGKASTVCAKHQLQAGWRLLALRERVEAGEAGQISWWDYFDTQFTGHIKSRKYAERLMKWARADDPDAAREVDMAANRQRNRATRQEQFGAYVCSKDDDDDEDVEPGIEDEIDPENYRTAYLLRADQAIRFASYSGPINKEVISTARRVAAAWTELAEKLERGGDT